MTGFSEQFFEPTFKKAPGTAERGPVQRDDAAAIKTYRYLRLGMIVVVVALVASVAIQHHHAHCWQGSISAYYYTPARPVFVSGLLAISVSLIIIKGSTAFEDMLLTAAGVLAPIVAFVPTTNEPLCVPGRPLGHDTSALPPSVVDQVHNNIGALLIAGVFALVIGIVVFAVEQTGNDPLATRYWKSRVVLLVAIGVALLVGWRLLESGRILKWHGWAAVFMFAFLGVASIYNGIWLWWINHANDDKTSNHWRLFAASYIGVGLAMLIAGIVIKRWPDPWDHRTLVLEFTEIGLFAVMWTVQSVERWSRILQFER